MDSLTPHPTQVDELDPEQPTGVHGNPPQDATQLRKRMVQVLRAFQEKASDDADVIEGFESYVKPGLTDEELVKRVQDSISARMTAPGIKLPSPSGLRTARHDLVNAGLLERAAEGQGLRKTTLGNYAFVWVLTQAGRDFDLPQ